MSNYFKLFTRKAGICLQIPVWDTKREKEYSSITDEKDNMIDNFLPQPNFKYYQNYDFHRLRTGLKSHKIFSLLHTNICKICKICKILLII